MNQNKEFEEFVKHLFGTTGLFSWIEQWRISNDFEQDDKIKDVFHFGPIMSQRFMLGFPLNKVKYGRNPFLAFQTEEYNWASLISWNKACVNLKEKRLYLVSKKMKSFGRDYFSSFAISIPFLEEKHLLKMEKERSISLKHLWYEDEIENKQDIHDYSNPIISFKSSDIVLPLFFVENIEQVLSTNDTENNDHISNNIIEQLERELNITREVKIEDFNFIQGNSDFYLSEAERKILESIKAPLDYEKPKIRIRVD